MDVLGFCMDRKEILFIADKCEKVRSVLLKKRKPKKNLGKLKKYLTIG